MRHVASVIAHAICNLTGKLARRGEGKHAGAAFWRVLVLAENMGQGRQRKASGFPCTRLGNAHDIASVQRRRNGLHLDRRWRLMTEVSKGARQRLCQVEGVKIFHGKVRETERPVMAKG